jgi:solute carrier family 8 (sodium/calcium exchanger)
MPDCPANGWPVGTKVPPCCAGADAEGVVNSGTLLPAFFAEESATVGAVVYLLLLLWTFIGVAIVSDVFMAAIEVITSKEYLVMTISEAGQERQLKLKVWNDTVANLTLMALGSSAPEILLSVIELFGNNMFSGDLGPATVVGSAAFNLFIISAVCVYCIEDGEVRLIEGTRVYGVTSTTSILAYFWLLVIVQFMGAHSVSIFESVLTFCFFPVLVIAAWLVDTDRCFTRLRDSKPKVARRASIFVDSNDELNKQLVAELRKKLMLQYPGVSDKLLTKLVAAEMERQRPKSRAQYRIDAVHHFTGGKRSSLHAHHEVHKEVTKAQDTHEFHPLHEQPAGEPRAAVIEWDSVAYSVLEKGEPDPEVPGDFTGYVTVTIRRSDATAACTVYYATKDGDGSPDGPDGYPRAIAHAIEDYIPSEGDVQFEAGELTKDIKIKIVDDDKFEDDEDFYVELSNVQCETPLVLGEHWRCRVTIIDDDDPGILQFTRDEYIVTEGVDSCAKVMVERVHGSTGQISCKYKTEQESAKEGADYTDTHGELTFLDSQTQKEIQIPISNDEAYEKKETFRVTIYDAEGGARFDENTTGGKESARCEVIIQNNDEATQKVNAIVDAWNEFREANRIGTSNWAEQFSAAIYVDGSKEDQAEAGCFDWFLHILSFIWKIIFAFVPPTDFCGGWLCFFVSLGMIGLVTALVGDLATNLGCSLDIPNDVTAITLVALGTSLPDTFASMSAATQDPYADASIGNIMGSNSVNVFLGLGLPWSMGAIYWNNNWESRKQEWLDYEFNGMTYAELGFDVMYPNGAFITPAGSLGFSVGLFSGLALLCIMFLAFRRVKFGGELGGERGAKIGSMLVLISLWVTYIVIAIWRSLSLANS